MADDLPTDYDVIIIGTGMVESIVSASVSQIGKRVLHLDPNSYYGHHWATFNFDNLEIFVRSYTNPEEANVKSVIPEIKEGITLTSLNSQKTGITNVKETWYVKRKFSISDNLFDEESRESQPRRIRWTKEKMRDLSRKFNIDLVPKFLFSKGEMVDLLIKSQVSRYTEFINVSNILVPVNGCLEPVPCSKSDIFLSENVSLVNKRILARLLMTCLTCEEDYASLKGFENRTFFEYLEAEKVPENLFPYIYAIAMSSKETLCSDAVRRAQKFLASLGCYGNSPFLWPLYGSSELLQAYCRLSAVHGAIYYLGKQVDAIMLDSTNKCTGVVSNNQLLQAENVVMSVSLAPNGFLVEKDVVKKFSRGILITNSSLHKIDKGGVSWFRYESESKEKEIVNVIELSSAACACPKGLYVVHLTCSFQKGPEEDFKEFFDKFFQNGGDENKTGDLEKPQNSCGKENDEKPMIQYSLLFELEDTSVIEASEKTPENVYFCSGPNFELDFDTSINQAKEIFEKMYPNDDFLQPPPNPNEE